MFSKGRRVVVVLLILAGVFLPLWLLEGERTSSPPDDRHVPQQLNPLKPSDRRPEAPSKKAPSPMPHVAAVRMPPPPELERPALSPVSRLRPSSTASTRPVTPMKPTPIEKVKRPKPELAVLKPSPQETERGSRKFERTLRPTPAPETIDVAPRTPRERPRSKPSVKVGPPDIEVRPETRPEILEVQVRPAAPEVRKGRSLLRLLEHGKGPAIEIAWPLSERDRSTLFRYLNACYGMRTALLDGQGRLYLDAGARGLKWEINLDRFSGFVRQPDGHITAAERRAGEKIRRYHGLIPATHIVRVFPRVIDAALLGGLKRVMGEGYTSAQTIRGRYRKTSSGLLVDDIVRDGRKVSGTISFPPVRGASCG